MAGPLARSRRAALVFVLVSACLSLRCRSEAASGDPEGALATKTAPREPLAPGARAPDFTALSHTGYSVRLQDLLERPVALYFCAGGLDESCTRLARALRDRWLTLNQRLSMALFVLPTGYTDNRAFATLEELPFLLLADADGEIQKSFGVGAAAPGAPVHGFLVSAGGEISKTWSPLAGAEHVEELSRALP